MVCLGNICRSPLAQGILEHKVAEKKLDWLVSSSGTSAWHVGEPPDRRSIEVAAENDINIRMQRSQQFHASDFEKYDHILVMDSSNHTNVCALAKNESEKRKVKLILNFSQPGKNKQVPDPYYEGGFQKVFDMLDEALEEFVKVNNE